MMPMLLSLTCCFFIGIVLSESLCRENIIVSRLSLGYFPSQLLSFDIYRLERCYLPLSPKLLGACTSSVQPWNWEFFLKPSPRHCVPGRWKQESVIGFEHLLPWDFGLGCICAFCGLISSTWKCSWVLWGYECVDLMKHSDLWSHAWRWSCGVRLELCS